MKQESAFIKKRSVIVRDGSEKECYNWLGNIL